MPSNTSQYGHKFNHNTSLTLGWYNFKGAFMHFMGAKMFLKDYVWMGFFFKME